MSVLQTVYENVSNLINSGSYFRSTNEMQTAISLANTQLYQAFRGNMRQYQKNSPKAVLNFGETTITLDSMAELFRILPFTGNPLVISLTDQVVDVVENLDVIYSGQTEYVGAKILPPNQWAVMKKNTVVPPTIDYPYARFTRLSDPEQYQTFEILPSTYTNVQASVYLLPPPPAFTLTDSDGPIPTINITQDLVWTAEKIPALTNLTIQNLGFTLQNGVLIEAAQALNAQTI